MRKNRVFSSHVEHLLLCVPNLDRVCESEQLTFPTVRVRVAPTVAQRRTERGLLHQGSVKIPGGAGAFSRELSGVFASRVRRRELSGVEMEMAQRLAAQKYATEAWLTKF